jgi:LPS-assembly protein
VYREAFSDNYNQAVTSDILSTIYITHEANGIELGALADRYQGIKVVATPQQQVHIFHAPTVSLASTEHAVPGTASAVSNGLEVSLESSASGLKRTQPNFETGGIIERFDLHPQASYPIQLANWHIVPSLAARETVYSRSRATAEPGQAPAESEAATSRADFEFALAIRPPVLERSFQPTHLTRLLGTELRHTIEPEVNYRLTDGVDNFRNILRFDAVDVVANTDEFEYGLTQRLFRRPAARSAARSAADGGPARPCPTTEIAQAPGFSSDAPTGTEDTPDQPDPGAPVTGRCPSEELISWRLTQKVLLDQTFGGAIADGRRNIFTSTLDLTGVAFLTEKREISPLISRLRVRSSAHTDVEWDFDYDTGANKFNSSNLYVDVHQGNTFGALSYARLDAPGRFFTENPTPVPGNAASQGVNSTISDFNQLRVLLGYGDPAKRGLSIAGNAGVDLKALYGATQQKTAPDGATSSITVFPALLQYATIQASYNWNCCGLAVEYRKFELGSERNEGTYRFNFTLANIGAAGNMRRAERLF